MFKKILLAATCLLAVGAVNAGNKQAQPVYAQHFQIIPAGDLPSVGMTA